MVAIAAFKISRMEQSYQSLKVGKNVTLNLREVINIGFGRVAILTSKQGMPHYLIVQTTGDIKS